MRAESRGSSGIQLHGSLQRSVAASFVLRLLLLRVHTASIELPTVAQGGIRVEASSCGRMGGCARLPRLFAFPCDCDVVRASASAAGITLEPSKRAMRDDCVARVRAETVDSCSGRWPEAERNFGSSPHSFPSSPGSTCTGLMWMRAGARRLPWS